MGVLGGVVLGLVLDVFYDPGEVFLAEGDDAAA